MKASRFITLGIFFAGGIILLLLTNFMSDDFYLASLLCLVLAIATFVPSFLDEHIHDKLKLILLVIGLLFFIASMVGLWLEEQNLPIHIYCLIFAILEIINGIAELNEAVALIKHKNIVMGILFVLDALFEVVLGILMVIERHETLHLHVTLIACDLFFEGTIKFINTFVEEKRESHE